MNVLPGKAISLQGGIGERADNAGRIRGLSLMTRGKRAYGLQMKVGGQRYAEWPESSLIPLDIARAILIAPIAYDDVDMATRATVLLTSETLLTIAAGVPGSPLAERTVKRLFSDDGVQ